MFDKLKELFMKNVGVAATSNKSEDGITMVSDKFNYEYDYENQKEI